MRYIEIEREFLFPSWLAQLLGVYFGSLVGISLLEHSLDMPDTFATEILTYVFFATAGLLLACLTSVIWRDAAREGALIWIVPAGLEVMCVIGQGVSGGPASAFHGLFFSAGPGQGEGSWGIVIVTLPTLCCCCYSIVMKWQLRRRKAENERIGQASDTLTASH